MSAARLVPRTQSATRAHDQGRPSRCAQQRSSRSGCDRQPYLTAGACHAHALRPLRRCDTRSVGDDELSCCALGGCLQRAICSMWTSDSNSSSPSLLEGGSSDLSSPTSTDLLLWRQGSVRPAMASPPRLLTMAQPQRTQRPGFAQPRTGCTGDRTSNLLPTAAASAPLLQVSPLAGGALNPGLHAPPGCGNSSRYRGGTLSTAFPITHHKSSLGHAADPAIHQGAAVQDMDSMAPATSGTLLLLNSLHRRTSLPSPSPASSSSTAMYWWFGDRGHADYNSHNSQDNQLGHSHNHHQQSHDVQAGASAAGTCREGTVWDSWRDEHQSDTRDVGCMAMNTDVARGVAVSLLLAEADTSDSATQPPHIAAAGNRRTQLPGLQQGSRRAGREEHAQPDINIGSRNRQRLVQHAPHGAATARVLRANVAADSSSSSGEQRGKLPNRARARCPGLQLLSQAAAAVTACTAVRETSLALDDSAAVTAVVAAAAVGGTAAVITPESPTRSRCIDHNAAMLGKLFAADLAVPAAIGRTCAAGLERAKDAGQGQGQGSRQGSRQAQQNDGSQTQRYEPSQGMVNCGLAGAAAPLARPSRSPLLQAPEALRTTGELAGRGGLLQGSPAAPLLFC